MDGYLRAATGLPVRIQAPELNAGALAGLKPIQLGGAGVQIRPLGGWSIPEADTSIAKAIESLGKSAASAIDWNTELLRKKKELEAEREFKKEEDRKDRELKRDIENARERIKKTGATEIGTEEADSFFGDLLPSGEGDAGSLSLISGDQEAPKTEVKGLVERSILSGAPDPSADQASRNASPSPLQKQTPSVPSIEPPKTAAEAETIRQAGTLEGVKAPPSPGKPYGTGEFGEPNLQPKTAQETGLPLRYPTVFKDMRQYQAIKDAMDKNPQYTKTLSGEPRFNPKTGQLVDVKYVDKAEIESKKQEKLSSAEEKQKKSDFLKQDRVSRLTLMEGKSIAAHPAFKNFESQNGLRPMTRNFLAAYNTVTNNPRTAGVSDIDLIDTYVRATSGGKVTEAQFKEIKKAKNAAEVLGLTVRDKPLSGALLSQGQRDQMLRTMLEMHNTAAEGANEILLTARKRMIAGGQSNEDQLPHPYVSNLLLKSDAEEEILQKSKNIKELMQEKASASRGGKKEDESQIDSQIKSLLGEISDLKERLKKEKYSGSRILGISDFKHKQQGYLGGSGGWMEFGSTQSGALQDAQLNE